MVACHHDNGIFQFPVLLQDFDGTGHQCVETLHLVVVVGHIASYNLMIGKTVKQADLLQIHTALHPGPPVIGSVRVR